MKCELRRFHYGECAYCDEKTREVVTWTAEPAHRYAEKTA